MSSQFAPAWGDQPFSRDSIVSTLAQEVGDPHSQLPQWVWDLWNQTLSVIRIHPALFFPLMRLRMAPRRAPQYPILTPETELVIEGYWRSGNTFATRAFQAAQPRPIPIAFHTHAAATVRRGVRMRKPILVLARPPLEAVSGRLFLAPRLSGEHALREYIRFYRSIEPFALGFVRASFDEVVADFGAVIERVNARFGTEFRLPGREGHSLEDIPRHPTDELPLDSLPPGAIRIIRERFKSQIQNSPLFKIAERVYQSFSA